jgi:MFS family permease
MWSVIFYFASAGASSAYLTVSEIFPLELRGQAISYFFAVAQGVGGSLAPTIFGHLIGGQNNTKAGTGPLSWGYAIGAAIMIIGGLVAWFIGVDSERQSLEDIAQPLSVRQRPEGGVTAAAEAAT